MSHFGVFIAALAGFALLLFAMPRHQQDWLKRKLSAPISRGLRVAGFVALVLAYVIAGAGLGWAYGAVVWCGWLTVAAVLTVTAQIHRERILARLRRRSR